MEVALLDMLFCLCHELNLIEGCVSIIDLGIDEHYTATNRFRLGNSMGRSFSELGRRLDPPLALLFN